MQVGLWDKRNQSAKQEIENQGTHMTNPLHIKLKRTENTNSTKHRDWLHVLRKSFKSCLVNNTRRVTWRHEHRYHDKKTGESGSFTEFPEPVGWLKNLGWEDTFRQIHDRCDARAKKRVSWHVWTTFSYIGTTLMVCRNALKDINETWYASCIYRLSD
jgi:hypothetical protein